MPGADLLFDLFIAISISSSVTGVTNFYFTVSVIYYFYNRVRTDVLSKEFFFCFIPYSLVFPNVQSPPPTQFLRQFFSFLSICKFIKQKNWVVQGYYPKVHQYYHYKYDIPPKPNRTGSIV